MDVVDRWMPVVDWRVFGFERDLRRAGVLATLKTSV